MYMYPLAVCTQTGEPEQPEEQQQCLSTLVSIYGAFALGCRHTQTKILVAHVLETSALLYIHSTSVLLKSSTVHDKERISSNFSV